MTTAGLTAGGLTTGEPRKAGATRALTRVVVALTLPLGTVYVGWRRLVPVSWHSSSGTA